MPIVAGDLKMYLTGGAANADPNASLGGVTSSVQFTDDTLGNLFANVTPAEALAGSTKYRALAFKNTSAFTAYAATIYISQDSTSDDTYMNIAYDATGTQDISDEDTAPIGLSFDDPHSLLTAISLGDIAASGEARIWFSRVVSPGAAQATDEFKWTITVGNAS
jgi:hypothetical protein